MKKKKTILFKLDMENFVKKWKKINENMADWY